MVSDPGTRRPSLLLLKLERAPPVLRAEQGDFEHYFARGLGLPLPTLRVVDATRGAPLPPPEESCGTIISGSSAMLTDPEPWIHPLQEWLRAALRARRPLLGVCFGHQLLAATLGGNIGWNPGGPEFGSEKLRLTEAGRSDPLFQGLPLEPLCQQWHRQAVTRLPPGAVLLAAGANTAVQAFRWGDRAWGVQFHPEFTAAVVRGYLHARGSELERLGVAPGTVLKGLQHGPAGPRLLRNFLKSAACAAWRKAAPPAKCRRPAS